MEFIAGRSFTKQHKQILLANDKLYEGTELHTTKSGPPLYIEIIKQTRKIMSDKEKHRDGKDVLAGEYRKLSAFAGYHIFASAGLIEDTWKAQFLAFLKLKRMTQLWPLQICLETLSRYIRLKMETEEFVA